MMFDHRDAGLARQDRALCDFAVKLTLTPGAMRERDVQGLREAGFTDTQIVVAAQVIAYFNYINRIADALGADDEDWFDMTHEEWLARKGRDYGDAGAG